jgi:hypothetical protein
MNECYLMECFNLENSKSFVNELLTIQLGLADLP